MCRNVCFSMIVWALCCMSVANAANIIWVDEGAAGSFESWQAVLEGGGHTVTQMTGMNNLDQGKIDAMNGADLVIVSRDTNSGGYDDGDEPSQWNGLTVPLIQTSAYLIRGNRWLWINNNSTPGVTDDMLIVEDHPIFRGVGGAGDEITIADSEIDISGGTDGGNGQVLATHPDGRLWIVYWDAEVEFYSGAGQTGVAPRMWFAAGFGNNSPIKGEMNLNEDGQTIFLNAIAFMTGGLSPELASEPSPAVEIDDVPRDVVLSWNPGDYAVKHDVYLGTVLDDVNTATTGDPLGVLISEGQDANSYDAGALAFGQTYFWRVDEVNGAPDNTVFQGELWQFTVEPFAYPVTGITATASSSNAADMGPEKTIDGSGLDALDQHSTDATHMWLSAAGAEHWIQYEFAGALKLHEMWVWNSNQMIESFIGLGAKDVTIETSLDGEAWTLLEGASEFAQATGLANYTANTTVAFNGTMAQFVRITVNSGYGVLPQYGLSEVRFFSIPTAAREPQPADGGITDGVDVTLKWRAGREAASHEVSLSTDSAAVADGTAVVGTSSVPSFDSDALDYGTTYFWKVDEVNEAGTPARYAGEVWSFTTPDFGIVDSFDQYDDKCNRIFFAWEDGIGHSGGEEIEGCDVPASNGNGGGSMVGNDEAPFAEKSIVTAGSSQSMPFNYDNSFGQSEATLSFPGQDWSASGVQTLALAFYGETGNTGTLYVKINNTKVTYDLDAADIARTGWQAWNIDLAGISGLQNVTSLTIGVDGGSAAGMLYIDDIRLYPVAGELITPADPGNAGLVAVYAFENNVNDSSGNGHNGTINGNPQYVAGQVGTAMDFDGLDDYISTGKSASDLGIGGNGPRTVTAWVYTRSFANGGIYDVGARTAAQDFCLRTLGTENSWRIQYWGGDQDFTLNTAETWVHFTHVHDGTRTKIYANGSLIVDWEKTIDTTDDNPFQIACYGWQVDFFDGVIDEVNVYSRALSAEEALFMAGRTNPVHKPL